MAVHVLHTDLRARLETQDDTVHGEVGDGRR